MSNLQIGASAPSFTLPKQNGELVSLTDMRGRNVVIWFFSRAFGSN
jgi:thioredoxin-dependent peroxiredoxin